MQFLDQLFRAALAAVEPGTLLQRCMRLEDHQLRVHTASDDTTIDLRTFSRVMVLAVGKAACGMASAVEDLLGRRITGGLAITKHGFGQPLRCIELLEAGHPVPDEHSVLAGQCVTGMAQAADEHTLVVLLLSGGGSSLLCTPYADARTRLSPADLRRTNEALLASGAGIGEVNELRKHLSLLKGGRLARLLAPATTLSLVLSDVIGDQPGIIASGPTAPDESTFATAWQVVKRYRLQATLPPSVTALLQRGLRGEVEETPKPGDPAFDRVKNIVLGNNGTALHAAAEAARECGMRTVVLPEPMVCEANEAAARLFSLAAGVPPSERPTLLLAGGETTVTLPVQHGTGGRNQQLALAFLRQLQRHPEAGDITLLSASTDGNDGPTNAAGGWASPQVLRQAESAGLRMDDYLRRCDAHSFFGQLGALYTTGPTGTNVCDLQLVLVQ